jgi:hypothetical protein
VKKPATVHPDWYLTHQRLNALDLKQPFEATIAIIEYDRGAVHSIPWNSVFRSITTSSLLTVSLLLYSWWTLLLSLMR